jgi:hypothetical protein
MYCYCAWPTTGETLNIAFSELCQKHTVRETSRKRNLPHKYQSGPLECPILVRLCHVDGATVSLNQRQLIAINYMKYIISVSMGGSAVETVLSLLNCSTLEMHQLSPVHYLPMWTARRWHTAEAHILIRTITWQIQCHFRLRFVSYNFSTPSKLTHFLIIYLPVMGSWQRG